MFGQNPKSLHEIEECLSQPDCTVDELLKCAGITSQFRNGNPSLIKFLQNEKNAKRIFEIIHSDPSRATQKSILSLFQTSNTSLHRLFAEYLVITEYAISILESDAAHKNFSVGIISRIISRAFDLWPDDMSEVFRISKTIYKTLITHMDSICVFHSVQDMITETHKGLWLFMWHCFRTLVGEDEKKYRLTRRSAFIDNDLKVDQSLMTDLHKDHIITVLRLFFKLKLYAEEEFANNVVNYIIDQKNMSELLFSLALSLHPNEVLLHRAVNIILKSEHFIDPVIEKALNYIAFAIKIVDMKTIIGVTYATLEHHDASNFILSSLKSLVDVTLNHFNTEKNEIITKLRRIIMLEYNKTSETENPLYFSFLISISISLLIGEQNDEQWSNYKRLVIDPWVNDENYDSSFRFHTENEDPTVFVINEFKE